MTNLQDVSNHQLNPVSVVLFKNPKDNIVTPEKMEVMTWGDFQNDFIVDKHDVISDKSHGTCISTVSYKSLDDDGVETTSDDNGITVVKRCANNVKDVYVLIVDIDDGMTVDEATEHFKDYEYFGYTSYGHNPKPENNDDAVEGEKYVEKFRLCFLLKTPVDKEEIISRKQSLFNWVGSADKTTFDRGRIFFTPSCPEHMLEHAKIWSNIGKLVDVLSFDKDQEKVVNTDTKAVKYQELTIGQRESIISGLMQTDRVEDDRWYQIAGALHNSGFTVQDFIEASTVLKPSKSPSDCIKKWESSQKYGFSLGVVINFLKEHDIFIYQKREVDNSEEISFVKKEIELLDEKVERIKSNEKLTDDERKKQLKVVDDERELKEEEVERLIEEEEPTLCDQVDELISERLIYYVSDAGIIVEYLPKQGLWINYKVPDFINGEFLAGIRGARSFLQRRLQTFRRSYRTQILSAKHQPPFMLNRFRRDHWVTPKQGKYHSVFDILIRSLGDNKTENMLHLMQVIAWKYLYPEDYTLPCVVIYGEGGAGKNTLVERVLGTLFGKRQVIAIRQEQMRNFNGLIAGMVAVLLDEASSDKANMDQLKAMIGQESLVIDSKYGQNYRADNIALYFTGGNGALGAVYLGRDQSDRRFSILQVDRSIIDHVMEVEAIEDRQVAVNWWNESKHLLEDKDQLAMWLNHILKTVDNLATTPSALHGQDYEALLAAQAGPLEWIVEHVFDHPKFKYIDHKIPFELYVIKCKEYGTKNPMGKQTFDAKLREVIRKKHPELVYKSHKVRKLDTRKTTGTGYFLKSVKGYVDEECYIHDDPDNKNQKVLSEDWFSTAVVTVDDGRDTTFDSDLME
jgi:Family of unknown function (DUF5906)